MPQYVLSEADKNALARLLSKTGSAPPRPAALAAPIRAAKGPDAMWALPPCQFGIPAAGNFIGTKPGMAMCCLWHDKGDGLQPMLDPMGSPIRQVVHNYADNTIQDLVQIYRHRDGKWVAEQPDAQAVTTTQNPANTSTTLAPSPCTGDCIFTADSSLTWTGPTGGCQGTTTTSTTTTSTTTTTVTTTTATTTTPSPAACVGKECRLICVDTGTTPAPVDGVPPAYVKFKYELLSGYECDGDCGCYGLGDPCFLEDGEIVSQCLQGTTTTTPAPVVYTPCELAELLMGAPAPGESRFAALPGKPETWEVCQACEFGSFTQYGTLEQLEQTIYNDIVLVAKQTCLKDPCQDLTSTFLALRPNATFYSAYNYTEQAFGAIPPEMIDLKTGDELLEEQIPGNWEPGVMYYKPYWKKCLNCPKGQRDGDLDWHVPSYLRTVTPQEFIDRGDEESEDYDPDYPIRYNAKTVEISIKCAPGPDCSFCSEFPVPPTTTPDPSITTTSLAPTTTATTTTLAPCSCPQPAFCPTVAGQCTKTVCQRGGDALPAPICGTSTTTPAPNTCFDGLKWRYCPSCDFVDNTTTTAGPTTTLGPCTGTIRYICNSARMWEQVVATCAGDCSPDWCGQPALPVDESGLCAACGDIETRNCGGCTTTVAPTTTPGPCGPPCSGECAWKATTRSGGDPETGPFSWQLSDNACNCGCGCLTPPATPPATICDIAYTACEDASIYQPCCCTTLDPCRQSCTWNSPGGSTWDKIIDPCSSSCPCPAPPRTPSSTCDTYTVRCDDGSTTTTTSTTTTSTTTTAPTGACCQLGSCYNTSSAQCTSGGGTWLGSGSTCDGCQGACCQIGTGACSQSFESGCPSSGGFIFGGIGSTCAGSPCLASTLPPTTTTTTTSTTTTSTTTTTAAPTGACCGSAGCFQVSSALCTSYGGTYQGDGTSCADGDCNGACCFPAGSCGVSSQAFCNGYYGTFQGYGTVCSPNPCPTTTTSTPPTTLAPGP